MARWNLPLMDKRVNFSIGDSFRDAALRVSGSLECFMDSIQQIGGFFYVASDDARGLVVITKRFLSTDHFELSAFKDGMS